MNNYMNIWLIYRLDRVFYDEAARMVVVAPDVFTARETAAKHSVDEGPSLWTNTDTTSCDLVGVSNYYENPTVICRDVLEG